MLRRLLLLVAALLVVLGLNPAPAAADDPATCDYQRYWDPAVCSQPWTVSIAQECAQARIYNHHWWVRDPVCRALRHHRHHR